MKVHDLYINLGIRKDGNDAMWRIKSNDSFIISGLPGSGKSFLTSQILAQLSYRKQLILDYSGEHYNRLRQKPVNARKGTWWLPHIHNLPNPCFSFDEMDRFDLAALNIAEGGSLILADLAEKKGITWKEVEEMLFKLPIMDNALNHFNMKFDINLRSAVNRATKQSLLTKMSILREVFDKKNGIEYDLPSLWDKYDQLVLNFDLEGLHESAMMSSRLFFGKFMNQIWPVLYKYSPIVCIEESKIPWPRLSKGEETFRSYDILNKFQLHQRRRTGSMLIAVVQNPEDVSDVMFKNYNWMIREMYQDRNNNRLFKIGDMRYWTTGSGKYMTFKVHNIDYAL